MRRKSIPYLSTSGLPSRVPGVIVIVLLFSQFFARNQVPTKKLRRSWACCRSFHSRHEEAHQLSSPARPRPHGNLGRCTTARSQHVLAPSMLISSMISMYFSCQSILLCPSTQRFVEARTPDWVEPLLEATRDVSTEILHTEWIVIPLIPAAAVPEVAVTSRRCDILLLSNSANRCFNDPRLSGAALAPDEPT